MTKLRWTSMPIVAIADEAWNHVEDDPNVMVSSFMLNGCVMHVTAYRVETDEATGIQHCEGHDEDLGLHWAAFGMDGPAATVTIDGGEWLLFAEPGDA